MISPCFLCHRINVPAIIQANIGQIYILGTWIFLAKFLGSIDIIVGKDRLKIAYLKTVMPCGYRCMTGVKQIFSFLFPCGTYPSTVYTFLPKQKPHALHSNG